MVLTGAASFAGLSPVYRLLRLAAGERCMKDGLAAAVGVRFRSDIVFYVLYGLI